MCFKGRKANNEQPRWTKAVYEDSEVLSWMWTLQTPCVTFYCERLTQPLIDSADDQSASGTLPRPSMKGVRRRDRGYLRARAWFHSVVCSRPIGAGDPSQDARGERRRGAERGESADGKVSRARLTRKQETGPLQFVLGHSAMRDSPKGALWDTMRFISGRQ